MEIRYGCGFASNELVVIQISAEIDGGEKLANELRQVIVKENIRRAYYGKQKIAYRITTSEKLVEQFPDVAAGNFQLVDRSDVAQAVDMGRVFFASRSVAGEK